MARGAWRGGICRAGCFSLAFGPVEASCPTAPCSLVHNAQNEALRERLICGENI